MALHRGPAVCRAGPVPPGWLPPGMREYVGSAHLTLDESRPWPWRLTHGSVRTIDAYYGYPYTTRDETADEYQARISEGAAGKRARRAQRLPRARCLRCGAHSSCRAPTGWWRATPSMTRSSAGPRRRTWTATARLSREEAQRMAESAIDADARQRMAAIYPLREIGEDDVRPSLNSLEVIRLLCPAPAVQPAAGLGHRLVTPGRWPRRSRVRPAVRGQPRADAPPGTSPGRASGATPPGGAPATVSRPWRRPMAAGGPRAVVLVLSRRARGRSA